MSEEKQREVGKRLRELNLQRSLLETEFRVVVADIKNLDKEVKVRLATKLSFEQEQKKGKRTSLSTTREMEQAFDDSWRVHVERVQENISLLRETQGALFPELLERGKNHDISMLNDEQQRLGFVLLLDSELNDLELNDLEKKVVANALQSHALMNRHNPKHFCNLDLMKPVDLAEMICCWAAKQQVIHRNSNLSPRDYWKTVASRDFFFRKPQRDLIEILIDALEAQLLG